MLHERDLEPTEFRDIVAESFAALRMCFGGKSMATAALGLGSALVVAGGLGLLAGALLLGEALPAATMAALAAAGVAYVGLLVTYAALARLAVVQRSEGSVTPGGALMYAVRRAHIVVGAPMFTLVVAIAITSILAWASGWASAHVTLGAILAPVALVVSFAVNLVLVCIIAITHGLTGPCVAALDPSLAGASTRLTQIAQQRLPSFLATQVAVLVVGLPLLLVTLGLSGAAFAPAFQSVNAGLNRAATEQAALKGPMPVPLDASDAFGIAGSPSAAAGGVDGPLGGSALGLAPLVGVAVVVLLLVAAPLLSYAAAAQSSVYLALTGDEVTMAQGRETESPPRGAHPKHPPIVHCWRCDAINRFDADRCSKCNARMRICPSCFATNEVEREECLGCGKHIAPDEAAVEESVAS